MKTFAVETRNLYKLIAPEVQLRYIGRSCSDYIQLLGEREDCSKVAYRV